MYIFYDTETSGLNKDFDEILQIALVFTDENLNVLASKKLECRRSPWTVPTPGAMLITGFSPDDLKNAKYSNYEMMKEVVNWMKSQHWPVIFAGYNTLGFDEGIMSQNFHQTLHDPRLTTSANSFNDQQNGRLDVMVLVKAVMAYMPGALKLETLNEFGSVSVSLGAVAAQNGVNLAAEDAHDAMNDIRATIGVAKLIQKIAPDIWEHMTQLSTKADVDKFVANNTIFTHSSVTYGKADSAVTTSLTEGVLFDLGTDPAPYMAMTLEQLTDIFRQKKTAPFRTIQHAEQPILMPVEKSDAVLPKDFDEQAAIARANLLKADPDFAARVAAAAAQATYKRQITQPEQMINSQIDPSVQPKLDRWIADFNSAPNWQKAAEVVNRFYADIGEEAVKADPDLRRFVNFAGRIVFGHAPSALNEEQTLKMRKYIASRILNPDAKAPYNTIPKARKELETIEKERAEGKAKWSMVKDSDIRALKLYYTAIEKEYLAFMPESYKNQPAPTNDNAPAADSAKDNAKPADPKFKP